MANAQPGRELSLVNKQTVLAQYGPIRLTIQAWDRTGSNPALAAKAGEYSFGILPRIAQARNLFRRGAPPPARPVPEPLMETMCRAVERVGQPDLGPMAAVAGAVSDEVSAWLAANGAVKAVVENGGDISIYLAPDQTATVGIRTSLAAPLPSFSMELCGSKSAYWGVATSSGYGGRGLNQGIADAAVCIAATGALADAAATAVSNSCRVDSPAVKMVPAESLYPDTDIPGILVTGSIGALSPQEISAALTSAQHYAQSLTDKCAILGSYVCLRGQSRLTSNFEQAVAQLVELREAG